MQVFLELKRSIEVGNGPRSYPFYHTDGALGRKTLATRKPDDQLLRSRKLNRREAWGTSGERKGRTVSFKGERNQTKEDKKEQDGEGGGGGWEGTKRTIRFRKKQKVKITSGRKDWRGGIGDSS